MKSMTCKQLGGACDIVFTAETFEEIAELSKQHGIEMMKAGEETHLEAMEKMRSLMKDPSAMSAWFEDKRRQFEAISEE